MHSTKFWIQKSYSNTFKEIGADVIFTISPLFLRAAFQRRIPFEEGAARVQETGICPCAATVLAVVVGERVALVAGVMVLVCKRKARIQLISSVKGDKFKLDMLDKPLFGNWTYM